MKWVALLALLAGCAGSVRPVVLPSDPRDVLTGEPRVVLQSPDITRGRQTKLGFMLLGHPTRFKYNTYRANLSVLSIDDTNTVTMWISPQVSRYHAVTLSGLYTARLPAHFVYMHVEICPLTGYNILGTPQVGKPIIQSAAPVLIRDIAAGVLSDQSQRNSSSNLRPSGSVSPSGRGGVPARGQ